MVEEIELPTFHNKGTSFLKTCLNGVNALSGIGIISIPYALSQGGWLSLVLFFTIAILTCYTGLLIQRCMDSDSFIQTYPDVGASAFGRKGRIVVATFMYLELYLVATGFLILEGDNLHKLFPDFNLEFGGYSIGGRQCFIMMVGFAILPSICLKDLSMLSYVSAGGVLSSIIIIGSVLWVGAVDGVGFSGKGKLVNFGEMPTSLSLYAFCYCAHPVFPTIYTSMKDKSKFSKVLIICFTFCTISYVSMAILGYLMYGDDVLSQVTLNLPTTKIGSKIAIYTTLIGPVTKYALMVTPIASAIGSNLPFSYQKRPFSLLIRVALLISTIIVALMFPFFGDLTALIGAVLSVTASILLPCICYLKISKVHERWGYEFVGILGIMILGILIGVMGTYVTFLLFTQRFLNNLFIYERLNYKIY